MSLLAVHTARAFTPTEETPDALILIEDDHILSVSPRAAAAPPARARLFDASNLIAAPGFLDVHIHGAGGHDVMEATPAALAAVASTVARFGTTSLLATTVTASPDDTVRSLSSIHLLLHRVSVRSYNRQISPRRNPRRSPRRPLHQSHPSWRSSSQMDRHPFCCNALSLSRRRRRPHPHPHVRS